MNKLLMHFFRPIEIKLSSNLRKDAKMIIPFSTFKESNNLVKFSCIYKNHYDNKNSLKNDTVRYIYCIAIVKKVNVSELHEIFTFGSKYPNTSNIYRDRSSLCYSSGDIDAEEKLDKTCILTMTPLQFPSRGIECTHMKAFNLDSFIMTMIQSEERHWVCPSCRKRCYRVIIDFNYMEALKMGNELYAMSDGRIKTISNKSSLQRNGDYMMDLVDIDEEEKDQQKSSLLTLYNRLGKGLTEEESKELAQMWQNELLIESLKRFFDLSED